MLQQTRVEAVIDYYRRFLDRFPTIGSLADAAEPDLLTAWAGLGYYSRARNVHRTAKQIAASGLPATGDELLALPGIGPYTAAAIGSIALNLPLAALDGNVIRVVSRIYNDASEISSPKTRRIFAERADELLDRRRPGDFNQAMMELGATICTPRNPKCRECPVSKYCEARAAGTEKTLPVKLKPQQARDVDLDLALIQRAGKILLVQREASAQRLAGFWELPEKNILPKFRGRKILDFRHQIVNDRFHITIWTASSGTVDGGQWFPIPDLSRIPLTTVTKKALARVKVQLGRVKFE